MKFKSILFVSLALVGVISADSVFAQTCNPVIKTSMDTRAEMEGRREIELAQKIILKADSVLEYTCFDIRIATVAATSTFQSDVVGQLTSDVGQPLNRYINNNFGHNYLGGRYNGPAVGTSTCNVMGEVWKAAKCMDFDPGYFQSFEDLANSDPRTLPSPCNSSTRNAWWNTAMTNTSMNDASAGYQWNADREGPYLQAILGTGGGCAPPVPTGLFAKVYRSGSRGTRSSEALDGVCPTPGCYRTGATLTNLGQCVP